MTQDCAEWERVMRLLHQLPEMEYAMYALGRSLHQSLRQADLNHTPEDVAYIAEVARRVYEIAPPERREQFLRWLEPGGVLRLWSR